MKISLPFHIFHFHFNERLKISIPLVDIDAIFLDESDQKIVSKFRKFIKQSLEEERDFGRLLHYFKNGEFLLSSFNYSIKAAPDGMSYPDFSISVDYFQYHSKNGIWGIIPQISVEAFAENQKELEANLEETFTIYLEPFFENQFVQELLPFIWQGRPELRRFDVDIPISKKSNKQEETIIKDSFLAKVGHPIQLAKKIAYGRDDLIQQIGDIFKTAIYKNILLIGDPQSGKTTLLWEFVRRQQRKKSFPTVVEVTAASLLKELSNDNHWKVNIKILIEELQQTKSILFIRNWMEMFETGKHEDNNISMGEYLYRFLEVGNIQIITECTPEQFSRIELIKPGFRQFFQIIKNPLSEGKLLQEIVQSKIKALTEKGPINISEDAISEVIRLNKRFSPYAGMPGKAIRFLERIIHNEYLSLNGKTIKKTVTKDHIIRAFSEESGIPLLLIDPKISFDAQKIEHRFKTELFGQDDAITTVINTLAVIKSAMTNLKKPIASFLFAGPTGVGKTELAKILSGFVFSNRRKMIRFDMSEFSSYQSIAHLLGTPNNTGLLTAAIRKNPFCVLLFDEIDKAHPKFYELLLQILDEGRLTDGKNEQVNFCSTIIIMTSNIGVKRINQTPVGYEKSNNIEEVKDILNQEIRKFFSPEVYNRIDHTVVFYPISESITESIIGRELNILKTREGLKYRKISMKINQEAISYLSQEGFDKNYGARNLQRTIRKKISVPLSKKLNQFDAEDYLDILIDYQSEKLQISINDNPLSVELLIEEMEISDLANDASALRKAFYFVRNSYIFNQIHGQQEYLLTKSLKKHEEARELAFLMEIIEEVQNICRKVEVIETKLSLAFLKLGTFYPKAEQELNTFRERLLQLKLKMLSYTFPDNNNHYLYFFGSRLEELVAVYKQAIQSLGFEVSMKTIWHFHSKQTTFFKKEVERNKDWELRNVNYIVVKKENLHLKKRATPCGIQLHISGAGARYSFQNENFVLECSFSTDKPKKIVVVSSQNSNMGIPAKIHKQEFYNQRTASLFIILKEGKETKIKHPTNATIKPLLPFLRDNWKKVADDAIEQVFN